MKISIGEHYSRKLYSSVRSLYYVTERRLNDSAGERDDHTAGNTAAKLKYYSRETAIWVFSRKFDISTSARNGQRTASGGRRDVYSSPRLAIEPFSLVSGRLTSHSSLLTLHCSVAHQCGSVLPPAYSQTQRMR